MIRYRAFKIGRIGLALLTLLVVPRPSIAQPRAQERATDRDQISAILARWEEAWNTHNMTAFSALFHDDGIWVLWTGSVWTGRRAIEEGRAEAHRTVFRKSVQREQLEELTFVGPDAAIARFCSVLTGDERSPGTVVRSLKVLVVTRRQGTWKVGWGQNTRLADNVPDSPCFDRLKKKVNGA
jgi:uncharacterized protein (TIGR02246 family)